MNLYLDDDSASRQLVALLQKAGHNVMSPGDFAIVGAADSVHFTQPIRSNRVLLTRNARDFRSLHELVLTSGGAHPGVLVLHFENDPTRDLTAKGTVAAVGKLENSGLALLSMLHVLNHWR
jgi:predicted nuclease of predicted toxin-antitoxin system